jgi:glycine/D-amino acid oxidase-like deaminating enzyme
VSSADVVVIGAGVMGASETRSLDVGVLRPGRFADGQPNPAPVLL